MIMDTIRDKEKLFLADAFLQKIQEQERKRKLQEAEKKPVLRVIFSGFIGDIKSVTRLIVVCFLFPLMAFVNASRGKVSGVFSISTILFLVFFSLFMLAEVKILFFFLAKMY